MREVLIKFIFNVLPPIFQHSLLTVKPSIGLRISTQRILGRHYQKDMSFILIGANDGIQFDTLDGHLAGVENLRGIAVEPVGEYFSELTKNFSCYENVRCVNLALHPTDNQIVMYKVAPEKLHLLPPWAKGIASVLKDHHKISGIPTEHIREDIVNCIDFSTLLKTYGFGELNGSYNYLQIDVEGYDAEIIKMIDFNTTTFDMIKFERKNLSKWDYETTETILTKAGYKIYHQIEDSIAVKRKIKFYLN